MISIPSQHCQNEIFQPLGFAENKQGRQSCKLKNYKDAYASFQKAIKNGNLEAHFNLAQMYLSGIGVQRDEKMAVHLFKQAAGKIPTTKIIHDYMVLKHFIGVADVSKYSIAFYHLNNKYITTALSILGNCYTYGTGVNRSDVKGKKFFDQASKIYTYNLYIGNFDHLTDQEKKFDEIKKFADTQCEPEAQNQIADMYFFGHGVKTDIFKSLPYYKKAAKQNNGNALCKLGDIYEYGATRIPINQQKSLKYYEKSARTSNVRALYILGKKFKEGDGVEKDLYKAYKYFDLATNMNDNDSKIFTAEMCYNGKGTKQNLAKAFDYFSDTAKKGSLFAWYNLGMMYFHGDGVPQNPEKALECLMRADQKCKLVNFQLGIIHKNQKALDYLKYAKNPTTYCKMGLIYLIGEGIKRNLKKSFYYFKKAADLKVITAQCCVGKFYLYGLGVEKNVKLGLKYLNLAADHNHPSAYDELGKIYTHGVYVKKDQNVAVRYFNYAEEIRQKNSLPSCELLKFLNGDDLQKIYFPTSDAFFEFGKMGYNAQSFLKLKDVNFRSKLITDCFAELDNVKLSKLKVQKYSKLSNCYLNKIVSSHYIEASNCKIDKVRSGFYVDLTNCIVSSIECSNYAQLNNVKRVENVTSGNYVKAFYGDIKKINASNYVIVKSMPQVEKIISGCYVDIIDSNVKTIAANHHVQLESNIGYLKSKSCSKISNSEVKSVSCYRLNAIRSKIRNVNVVENASFIECNITKKIIANCITCISCQNLGNLIAQINVKLENCEFVGNIKSRVVDLERSTILGNIDAEKVKMVGSKIEGIVTIFNLGSVIQDCYIRKLIIKRPALIQILEKDNDSLNVRVRGGEIEEIVFEWEHDIALFEDDVRVGKITKGQLI